MSLITLHSPLKQVLRHTVRKGPAVGIELEYEKFNMNKYDSGPLVTTDWMLEFDHSLRDGGIELISRVLKPEDLDGALRTAEEILRRGGGVPTIRCGTHIHVNMTDFRLKELFNHAVLYTLVEPTLFKLFADGREQSHFCVPVWTQTTLGKSFYNDIGRLRRGIPVPEKKVAKKLKMYNPTGAQVEMMMMDEGFHGGAARPNNILTLVNSSKYSAVNFHALQTHGTIEYRMFRGTANMAAVRRWVNTLLRIRAAALEDEDPLQIIERYEVEGLPALLNRLEIPSTNINPADQEDAEDVATLMAGYISPSKNELSWELA